MKKICILFLGRRGAGPVDTYEMARQFLEMGLEVDIYISRQVENKSKFEAINKQFYNCKITYIDTYRNKFEFLFKTLNLSRFIRIARQIDREYFDFIYLPMISLWSAIICLFIKHTKINAAIHDPESHLGEYDFLTSFLFDKCAQKADVLTVFSKKFIELVCKRYNKRVEQICLLRLSGYTFYKNNFNKSEKKVFNRVLFFGRIVEYKGLSYLLEAAKEIVKENSDFKVKVVGSGTLSEREKSLIQELGDTVELFNIWVKDEDVEDYFSDIDFVVLPYVEATQSGIILLSYAMGKSILATDVGAIDEQVLPDTGIIVEPKSVDGLVKGIKKMYFNNAFIVFGNRGYQLVTTEWTFPVQAKKLIEFMYGK